MQDLLQQMVSYVIIQSLCSAINLSDTHRYSFCSNPGSKQCLTLLWQRISFPCYNLHINPGLFLNRRKDQYLPTLFFFFLVIIRSCNIFSSRKRCILFWVLTQASLKLYLCYVVIVIGNDTNHGKTVSWLSWNLKYKLGVTESWEGFHWNLTCLRIW